LRTGNGRSGSWPGASGYQTQAPPQILVGWAMRTGIDLLRILWPTGVLQDEIDCRISRVIAMKEADRRGSSCPVLFAWDGHKYKFVTDVIGAAWWGTGLRRRGAIFRIPANGSRWTARRFAPVNGKLSLRFMEPMEEVNYIDQLRLVAVDHPENVEVNPDERFLDDPPFASGRVVATQARGCLWARGMARAAMCWIKLSRRDHNLRADSRRCLMTALRICTRSRWTWAM
jgi:hypothetical protein